MQLKKINQGHYVVVTDEPIKEDCYALHISPLGEEEIVTANGECKLDKKITHSTKPIEEIDRTFMSVTFGWNKIQKLDLSYIKSLVGEVDIEKKAKECIGWYDKNDDRDIDTFINGYNQCLEDNKDKRFSEEDMRKVLELGLNLIVDNVYNEEHFKKLINSITQPKDTWEVEFDENNNLKLK